MVRIYTIPCVYTVYISNKKQAKYKKQANKYIILQSTRHTQKERRDSKKKRIKKEKQEKKLHIFPRRGDTYNTIIVYFIIITALSGQMQIILARCAFVKFIMNKHVTMLYNMAAQLQLASI